MTYGINNAVMSGDRARLAKQRVYYSGYPYQTMMRGVCAIVERGDGYKLDAFAKTREAFMAIGFPEDAAAFLGEWYPETWMWAVNRWRYGVYDWCTVGVFDSVDEVLALYDGVTLDELTDYGFIVEDASFEGVIALIEY